MIRVNGKSWRLPWAGLSEEGPESARVLGLFVYLFCVVSASTVGRTAADTLFLSKFDSSKLSFMYLPQAASLILVGFLFQRYGSRIRLDRLLLMLIPALSSLVALSWLGVGLDLPWIYPVIYVGYDVFNFLMIVCFWQFVSSVLDQRKAKKTIPIVGSGGIVGGIVSGFGLKLLAPLVGAVNLIGVYAGLQLLALGAALFVIRLSPNPAEAFGNPPKSGKEKAEKKGSKSGEGLFKSVPHLKYVAILSGALVISLTFVDYQFKVILKETLQNEALAGFMGSFYGFSGLCALFIQLFVAGKLLSRFGVMTSILVFPVALFAGSLGVLMMPILAMTMLTKGSDKVLGDTINSSVNQLIMFPISPQWRNRAKSFLDGVIRNGAKGLAAISLIALSPVLSAQQFSYVIAALVAVAIFAAVRVKGAYLKMLLSSLESKETDLQETELDLMDPASRVLLVGALESRDGQQALYALRILSGLEQFDLSPHVSALLRHPYAEVGIEALRYVERAKPAGMEPELLKLQAEDVDRGVKAQALVALAAYAQEAYLEPITERLEEADVGLRSGAIAGLIKYYGIEGMFRAVGTFKTLIGSTDERERTEMAALFGRIGIREFYKPLLPLLQDQSADVRRNALRSAGILAVPELVPHLVPLLRHSSTRGEAIEALAAYEESVVLPLLEPYLTAEDGDPAALHVPKAFERIGTQDALGRLLRVYPKVGFDMRDKLLEAMAAMRRDKLQADAAAAARLALEELSLYGKFAERLAWQPEGEALALVHAEAEHARAAMIRRVFLLIGLYQDARTIDAIYQGWSEGDARRQANAAEAIDQMLQGELRTELGKWMLASRSAAGKGVAPTGEQLAWMAEQDDGLLREWIRFASLKEGTTGAEDEELRETMWRMRVLSGSSLFEGIGSKDLMPLARFLREVEIPQGEYAFREKDPGDSIYFVREGVAGVYRGGKKVDERGAGDNFGNTAVLTRRLRTASIRAETDLRLLRLDSVDFYEAMFDRSELALEMMKRLSSMLRSAMEKQPSRPAVAASEADEAADEAAIEAAATVEPATVRGDKEAVREEDRSGDASKHGQAILRRVLVLQRIELFSHLAQDDFVRLAQLVEEESFEPGEAICRMDEHGDTMYGIIEGAVRVHRGAETLATLGVGQYFGEMAIIDSGPRSADCTAQGPTVLLKLDRRQTFSFCFQRIEVLKGMMKVLADRLRVLG